MGGVLPTESNIQKTDIGFVGSPTSGVGLTELMSVATVRTLIDSLTSVQIAAAYQPLDADLTTIAGLTPTTDSFIQAKAGAWSARTIAEVRTDLAGGTGTLATQAYADALVVGLLDDRGHYDASGNVFPSSGGSGTAVRSSKATCGQSVSLAHSEELLSLLGILYEQSLIPQVRLPAIGQSPKRTLGSPHSTLHWPTGKSTSATEATSGLPSLSRVMLQSRMLA